MWWEETFPSHFSFCILLLVAKIHLFAQICLSWACVCLKKTHQNDEWWHLSCSKAGNYSRCSKVDYSSYYWSLSFATYLYFWILFLIFWLWINPGVEVPVQSWKLFKWIYNILTVLEIFIQPFNQASYWNQRLSLYVSFHREDSNHIYIIVAKM